jgi:hypothetical protein
MHKHKDQKRRGSFHTIIHYKNYITQGVLLSERVLVRAISFMQVVRPHASATATTTARA